MTLAIKQITLNGWKRQRSTVPLSPLTMLCGPNGSGKSAVLQAIQFAFTGTTDAGGRLEDTATLIGDSGGIVTVEMTDEFAWQRAIERNSVTGGTAATVTVNGRPGTVKAATEALEKRVGCFAPAFNLRDFLDLSSEKRRQFVLDLCAKVTPRPDLIEAGARLRAKAIQELFSTETYDATARKIGACPTVADLVTNAKLVVNDTRRSRDEATEAARGIADTLSKQPPQVGKVQDLRAESDMHASRVREIDASLAEQRGAAQARVSLQQAVDRCVQNIETLKAQIVAYKSKPHPTDEQCGRLSLIAKSKADAVAPLAERVKEFEQLPRPTATELKHAFTTVRTLQSDTGPWERACVVMDDLLTALEAVEELPGLRKQLADATNDLESAKHSLLYAERGLEQWKHRMSAAEEALEQAEKSHALAVRDLEALTPTTTNAEADQTRGGLVERMNEIARIVRERQDLTALAGQLETTKRRAADLAQQHECAKVMHAEARAIREEYMVAAIEPLLSRMNTVLKACGRDYPAYCKLEKSTGAPTFELGWGRDEECIAYTALSGGEQAVFGLALAFALVDMADVPCKVLLLEAGECDALTLNSVMEGLAHVAPGRIANVVLASHVLPRIVPKGWLLHRLMGEGCE